MSADRTPDRVKGELKRASGRAYGHLQAEGFNASKVAYATGLSEAVIRRLKSDGDKSGWRLPTPRTAKAIDEYCLTRLGQQFGLLALREEFDRVGGIDAPSGSASSTATIRAYLADLRNTVVAASPWLPFTAMDDGFQLRKVTVSESAPRRAQDSEIASARVRRGDVAWDTALSATRVAAVIADAGYGKSWQSRRHTAQLAGDGLAAADPADVSLPLWMHAADLARVWPATNPNHALADAATVVLREVGVDTRLMQDAVGVALADSEWPCVVMVDAYDEIVGVRQRATARLALSWISRWAREGSGRQLIVTSRAAGWDDPVAASNTADDPTSYLYLGALEEAQVRRLWRAWFDRRSVHLPQDRLGSVLAPGSSLRQFARIPLIAAFCAWVAETTVVAGTRAQLFDQVVDKFVARTWKMQDTSGGDIAGDPDDGARRAAMATALGELAWEMAVPMGWVDAVSVGECEALLRRSQSVAPATGSLTFEAVRGIGILVQPAAIQGDRLGDGPVTWIHRSIHEFMTARHLRTLPPEVVADVAERAWHHPALSGVLDFALGLEPPVTDSTGVADAALTPVRAAIVAVIDSDRDPLGYYSTLVAASGQCTRIDVDRVWALYRAGVVSAVTAAQSLATSGGDADWYELVARLRDDPLMVAAEVHESLAWCGPPGRAALSEIIATDASAAGASNPLYRVDPDAAVAAVEARIAAGFLLASSDGPCLQNIGAAAFTRLLENAQNAPHVGAAAAALGYTRRPEALRTLTEHLFLGGIRLSAMPLPVASQRGTATPSMPTASPPWSAWRCMTRTVICGSPHAGVSPQLVSAFRG